MPWMPDADGWCAFLRAPKQASTTPVTHLKRQAMPSTVRQMDAVAPINRLSPELVAEIMIQGLSSHKLYNNVRWKNNLLYLRALGAISSGWRRVRDDTAALWTFIFFECHDSYHSVDDLHARLLFLTRSKGSLIDLELYMEIPSTESDYFSYLSHLYPHFHRCRSLFIEGDWSACNKLFPLPSTMRSLQALQISCSGGTVPDLPAVAFFEDPTTINLHSLWLREPFIVSLSNIPSNFITSLTFRERGDDPLAMLSFAAQCPMLESFDVGDLSNSFRNNDGLADGEIYTYPRLISLDIHDQIPPLFPFFMSTPQLQVLRISCTTDLEEPLELPTSRIPFDMPHLCALSLEYVDFSCDGSAVLAYVFGLRQLRLLELIQIDPPGLWLERLFMVDEGEKQDMCSVKLPMLEWMRCYVRMFHHPSPNRQIGIHNEFELLLPPLMKQCPDLTLEVLYIDNLYDMLRGEPEVTTGRLRFRDCGSTCFPCHTPLEELLSIVRGDKE